MTIKEVVIPSERSESRDLGTDLTANGKEMRRFLDSLRSLEMTALLVLLTSCLKLIVTKRIYLIITDLRPCLQGGMGNFIGAPRNQR